MKLRKNAILSLLLALICFFAACDEAALGGIDAPEMTIAPETTLPSPITSASETAAALPQADFDISPDLLREIFPVKEEVYLIPYNERKLLRCNTVTGEYTEVLTGVDNYTEYNGKIYYIRTVRDEVSYTRDILACYDTKNGQMSDLFDLPSSERSSLIAHNGFIYFSTAKTAYRIPAEGGEAEILFDIIGHEAIYCVIGKKLIIVNRFANYLNSSTPTKSTITALDLDTGERELLWSAENTEYGRIANLRHINGKLYFTIGKNGNAGVVLLALDLESRELYSIVDLPVSVFFFTADGIYYHMYEQRSVNWRSSFSSSLANQSTPRSSELYMCDFNGKNSKVVFSSADIAGLSCTIVGGKMIGSFCGDFPSLGMKRALLVISVDLSTGKQKLIYKPFDNLELELMKG